MFINKTFEYRSKGMNGLLFLIWWDLFFLLVFVEKNQVGIFMNILKSQLDIPLVQMRSTMKH